MWQDVTNAVVSDDGTGIRPQVSGLGWGSIGAVATEAITGLTDIIGVQFQCDEAADAMCGLNADHADSSWQDLDYMIYCHPFDGFYWSDPSNGPEDVSLGPYSADDIFQIWLNADGDLEFTRQNDPQIPRSFV